MELQITGKNLPLTFEVRSYIERKLGRLNRHLPNIIESKVELAEEMTRSPQERFVVQMTIDSKGTLLRTEERADDLYAAVDKVAKIMLRQIDRYKGKLHDKGRGNARARGKTFDAEAVPPAPRVVRIKRYVVKPMSTATAIEQMELLGHDFFLFLNADSDDLNVLYQRKDGNYGLIEPEPD